MAKAHDRITTTLKNWNRKCTKKKKTIQNINKYYNSA